MTMIHKRKKVNFKSVEDLNQLIVDSIPTLPKDLSLIVAVPRSGYIVAGLIALNLNLPLCSLNEYLNQFVPVGGRRTGEIKLHLPDRQKVLIVDDSVSSGWEMRRVREQVDTYNLNHETVFLAAYASSSAWELVDIALEIIDPPQIFEWNVYHHPHLINSCVDIDGVLCRDATKEEDDDGERYLDFLKNVQPRIIPTVKIGWLITSRLEKYRAQTEKWLEQQGVQYENLIMQDLPDLETRRKLNSDAKFKAKIYASLNAFFFIESSVWQSQEIAKRTGKAVFCVDNRSFIQAKTLDGKGAEVLRKSGSSVKKIRAKLTSLPRRLKPSR